MTGKRDLNKVWDPKWDLYPSHSPSEPSLLNVLLFRERQCEQSYVFPIRVQRDFPNLGL